MKRPLSHYSDPLMDVGVGITAGPLAGLLLVLAGDVVLGLANLSSGNSYVLAAEMTTAVIISVYLIRRVRKAANRQFAQSHGLCVRCGYNLTGNVSGVCPECGEKIQDS